MLLDLLLTTCMMVTPPPSPTVPVADAMDVVDGDATAEIWKSLEGEPLTLWTTDGLSVRGPLVRQTQDELIVVRETDGIGVAVLRSRVASVRVHPPQLVDEPSYADGKALIGWGSVLVSLGSTAMVAGGVTLGLTFGSAPEIYLPTFLIGVATLATGMGLLGKGSERRRLWKAAQTRRVALGAFPSPSGNGRVRLSSGFVWTF